MIEVGCGAGTLTTELATRMREVVAVDTSTEMIEWAKAAIGVRVWEELFKVRETIHRYTSFSHDNFLCIYSFLPQGHGRSEGRSAIRGVQWRRRRVARRRRRRVLRDARVAPAGKEIDRMES